MPHMKEALRKANRSAQRDLLASTELTMAKWEALKIDFYEGQLASQKAAIIGTMLATSLRDNTLWMPSFLEPGSGKPAEQGLFGEYYAAYKELKEACDIVGNDSRIRFSLTLINRLAKAASMYGGEVAQAPERRLFAIKVVRQP